LAERSPELLQLLTSSVPKINSKFGALQVIALSSEDGMAIVSVWARQEDLTRMRASDEYRTLLTSIREGSSDLSDAVYSLVTAGLESEPKPPLALRG
jgi:hypothetical protein